ncbi:DeoR/GlpR family DNA-binding transcription regulator [Eubacteriales bacterium OttesenSCG-928-M02]|nr:DeoR/GlpR family DNA-binding transcription regulator [Eubacteriales bacterium OttesenSCG-928-M02]
MTTAERRIELYSILQADKTVEVSDLAKRFSVSTMTVRRDLAMFEKQGLVTTNYGGAYLNEGTSVEPSFTWKSGQQIQNKKAMGRAAAELVKDGESIILDCGTTTMQMVPYLLNKKITIVTASWGVIRYFQGNTKAELVLAPGRYSQTSNGAMSEMTIEFFRNIHVDKTFVGADGVDLMSGATVPDSMDAYVKKAIMQSGKECILMATGDKLEKRFLVEFSPLRAFRCLITDETPGDAFTEGLKRLKTGLVIATPQGLS